MFTGRPRAEFLSATHVQRSLIWRLCANTMRVVALTLLPTFSDASIAAVAVAQMGGRSEFLYWQF